MSTRVPPLPTAERADRTARLIREQATDTSRWANMDSLATQWDARAALAADWIPDRVTVLDIGAGAMTLGTLLKPGCVYTPADVVERRPGCQVVDLNRREFPVGRYDWLCYLGVLEYIHDVDWALQAAHAAAGRMIVTYCTYIGGDPEVRRGMGWVNDYTQADFEATLVRNSWLVDRRQEVKRGPTNIQMMYACGSA